MNVVPQAICLAGTCAEQGTATTPVPLQQKIAPFFMADQQEVVVVHVGNALQIPHAQVPLAPKLFARI